MAKTKKKSAVFIKVKRDNRVTNHTLRSKETLTIGRKAGNDILVFDQSMPETHELISCKNGTCTVNISKEMTGEITYHDTELKFQDLMLHDLLPFDGYAYNLHFAHGRSGAINVAGAHIAFIFDSHVEQHDDLPAYSWQTASGKSITKDMLFKFLLVLVLAFEVMFGFFANGYDLPPETPPDAAAVPKRFTKFVIKQPEKVETPEVIATNNNIAKTAENDVAEDPTQPNQEEQRSQQNQQNQQQTKEQVVMEKGLLALIGGRGGSSNQSKSVDFLLDQGLVKELDDLMGNTKLKKSNGIGRGNGTGASSTGGGDQLENLVDFGLAGGIDDILDDVEVEKVTLEKKGNVNIQKPQKIRGSNAAKVRRSAESVLSIINSQQGRVMYTYNRYLRDDPNLGGKVSFDVTIGANGRVSNVQIVESTINNQNFIQDLIRIIRRLKFEEIEEGEITVNLPFVFNKNA